jgi:hypothetical protein
MAINPNTNFSAGAVFTADQANRFPRGVVGVSQKVTDQNVTAEADVSGLSVTWTAEANRVYKFTLTMNAFAASASNLTVYLNDNSTNIRELLEGIAAGTPSFVSFAFYVTGITAGSKTYKIRSSATSSTTLYGTTARATLVAQLIVEDIGPS